jgi:mono/diheme cytochrome c family protein
LSHNAVASINGTGLAPRGLVLVGTKLFVQSFMSRNVTVFDVSALGGTNTFPLLATVSTQATELLSAQVLQGKKIFYNAADSRMSNQGYTSCASCHLDGDSDGQKWDFTQAGEGFRATSSLLGRGGTSEQGRVHWTGNFDEIQDFENDMRSPAFGGTGFLTTNDWNLTSRRWAPPKPAERRPRRPGRLRHLAAHRARQPVPQRGRHHDGRRPAGKALFESPAVGCATCHSGPELTDSGTAIRHDVGTISTAAGYASGQRLGACMARSTASTRPACWGCGPAARTCTTTRRPR